MGKRRRATIRTLATAALVSVLWCSTGVGKARADGMILPETISAGYLDVRTHHVQVTIDDLHAVTTVEQEFHNPYEIQVDGTYVFPVPPDAALTDFRVTVDGQSKEVTRQDTLTTNAILHQTVVAQQDPSLLRYMDWESLALELRLAPGESCHMVLQYDQVLSHSGGMVRYHYVLSTERYSSQPVEQVSLAVDIHSSSGLASVYSPSHPVTVDRVANGHARVSWEEQMTLPIDDFELFFAPAAGGFGGGLLTGQHDDQGYFLFLFSPEADPERDDTLPKDIVFVMDRSGSMRGEKIEQARDALHFILGQLSEKDRFSVVGFDTELSVLAHTLQPVTTDAVADARGFVDRLTAAGDTDLEAALRVGLSIMADSNRRDAARLIVFLTDGLPTAGITDDARIARKTAQTNAEVGCRLHVFGVGYDVNTHLLDRLAADNHGTVTYVQPGENLESVLVQFYTNIANPMLTDIEVSFEGIEVSEVRPETLPDLFLGSTLQLTGRYRAASETITVHVRGQAGADRRAYTYQFDPNQIGGHDFVPRLWATRQVGALLDQIRVGGQSEALIEAIQTLGMTYGLVTPYTLSVIEGQSAGAASEENMALYENLADLNDVSGQTTVQARVQNQAYQGAGYVSLSRGANIWAYAGATTAQLLAVDESDPAQTSDLSIDLSLLMKQETPRGPITAEWVVENTDVDRTVSFGSDAYFALAAEPAARAFLQSGRNAIFEHNGEVILVQDDPADNDTPSSTRQAPAQPSRRPASSAVAGEAPDRVPQPAAGVSRPMESHWRSSTWDLALFGVLAAAVIVLAVTLRTI